MVQALGMSKTIEVGSRVLIVEHESSATVVRFRRYYDGNYIHRI